MFMCNFIIKDSICNYYLALYTEKNKPSNSYDTFKKYVSRPILRYKTFISKLFSLELLKTYYLGV